VLDLGDRFFDDRFLPGLDDEARPWAPEEYTR